MKLKSPVWSNVEADVVSLHNTKYDNRVEALYAYSKMHGMDGINHPGVDVKMPNHTPIRAIRTGVVERIRQQSDPKEREIVIRDYLGHEHLYTHLYGVRVADGEPVEAGQIIGESGAGHLHFEHRVPSITTISGWEIIDPIPLLSGVITPMMELPTKVYRHIIRDACQYAWEKVGVAPPEDVFEAMILTESGGIPDTRSRSDARGLAQIIPRWHEERLGKKVAEDLGIPLNDTTWFDPKFSLFAGARLLAYNYTQCDSQWVRAIALYHSGSCNPPIDFVDGNGTSTNRHLAKYEENLKKVREDRRGIPLQPKEKSVTFKAVLSAGHRNTNRGGAVGEYAWTPNSVRAIRDEIVKRGGQAVIVQEKKNDGNFNYPGGLQAAARYAVELAKTHGPFDIYLSSHYDSSPGFHAIFADGAGDTKAINPRDVRLAEIMSKHIAKTKTVKMKSWMDHGVGVMSERETNVGSKGGRLGEFVGTMGFRDRTIRLIVEASGTGDKYIHDPAWVRNTYAVALVDAMEEYFGKFSSNQPTPVEAEGPKESTYPSASPIQEIQDGRAYARLDNGTHLIRVDLIVMANKQTPRLRYAWTKSESRGPDINKGEKFKVEYLIINEHGNLFYLTPADTRVIFEDVDVYEPDVD